MTGECGTMAHYRRGCRESSCRAANSERVRLNRADRLASDRLSHGTRSAYDAGCRDYCCLWVRAAVYARLEGRRPHLWRRTVTEVHRLAMEAWEAGLEAAMAGASYCSGTRGRAGERWTDEERDYRDRHPCPQFRDALIGLATRRHSFI